MKIDWDSVGTEYATTNCSYRDIAAKYNVSLSSVKGKGKENGWVRQRSEHRTRIATKAAQTAEERGADILARIQDNVYASAHLLSEKIFADLSIIGSMKSYEYGHYASALKTLNDLLPNKEQQETDTKQQTFVAILPERTEIDEGR